MFLSRCQIRTGYSQGRYRLVLLAILLVTLPATPTRSETDTLVLAIQPIFDEAKTRLVFRPLADYIERASGKKCLIRTSPNFFAYWNTIRKGSGYDLAFDAAHFTDYRVRKYGYHVLARISGSISYSLVVTNDNPIFDPMELTGLSVATLGIPSIGTARLIAMFPNPLRQPIIVETNNSEQGMRLLLNKKVVAAILPTPTVARYMAEGAAIQLVMTTEPIPQITISAAETMDPAVRKKIRNALVGAEASSDGREMLKKIGFEKFIPATAQDYKDYGDVLEQYWGY